MAVLGLWSATAVQAQYEPTRIQELSAASRVMAGAELVRTNQEVDALSHLQHAIRRDSALVVPGVGSALYWLGEAHARTGDSATARSVWRRGVQVLEAAERFDARLADAYLQTLTVNHVRENRLEVVDVYRRLLGKVGRDTSADVRSLFRRRVAQIEPLLSDDVFSQVVEAERSTPPRQWTFHSGAGDALQKWWRGLDPLPKTTVNERLEEHVTRLVRAQRQFSCAVSPSALDDRGLIHLRFGLPYKRHELSYKDGEFLKKVFRIGVPVSLAEFPESEIWLYTQIDESGFYLFAESDTSDCFRTATANDLIPRTLTSPRGNNDRGLNIAYSSLMAMRAIYQELALYHINFSARYSKIANYADWQEMKSQLLKAAIMTGAPPPTSGGEQVREVGAGTFVFSNPVLGISAANHFITEIVSQARREDAAAADRREERMPRQYTALLEGAPRFPVAVRTARFLEDDGSTRTEVYWGVAGSELALSSRGDDDEPRPSMVSFSAVQYDDNREAKHQVTRQYRIDTTGQETPSLLPPPVSFEGAVSPYHLSFQWTQYPLYQPEESSVIGIGPKRRFAVARADSLHPLRAEGPEVEMSDLQVMTLPDTSAQSLTNPEAQATPYPFRTLSVDTPLLLSFEVYHLNYGADDRTRYTVSYEARGETNRGWTRLLRGQDTQRTGTEMTVEGSQRQTDETILIDLSEIERDESQNVRITVRVTDEVTGATVSRNVEFVLQPRTSAD